MADHFTEEEEHREAASLFHTRIRELTTPEEREKALKETMVRVKAHSIGEAAARLDPTDIRGLQRLSRQTLGEELDGLPLAQRARAGDAGALAVWQQFGALLAEALTPALDAYRPQLCCLGGQVTASGTLFLEPLHRACRQRGVRLETTADTSLRAMQGALVT